MAFLMDKFNAFATNWNSIQETHEIQDIYNYLISKDTTIQSSTDYYTANGIKNCTTRLYLHILNQEIPYVLPTQSTVKLTQNSTAALKIAIEENDIPKLESLLNITTNEKFAIVYLPVYYNNVKAAFKHSKTAVLIDKFRIENDPNNTTHFWVSVADKTIMFTNSESSHQFHYFLAALPTLYKQQQENPKPFKHEDLIEQMIVALLKHSYEFSTYLQKWYKHEVNIKDIKMQLLLTAIDTIQKIVNDSKKQTITNCANTVKTLELQLAQAYNNLTQAQRDFTLLTLIGKDQTLEKEAILKVLQNKAIQTIDVVQQQQTVKLRILFKAPLDIVDTELLEQLIKKQKGIYNNAGFRKLMKALYIDKTHTLHNEWVTVIKITPISATWDTLDVIARQFFPQVHLDVFRCYGTATNEITKALNTMDIVTAVGQIVYAGRELNLTDATVMQRFYELTAVGTDIAKLHTLEVNETHEMITLEDFFK